MHDWALISIGNVSDEQGQRQVQGAVSIELELHSGENETNASVTTMAENELVGYENKNSGKGKGKGLGTVLEHGLCFKSDTQKSKGYFWKIFVLSFSFSLTNSIIVFLAPCYLPSFVESICD